MHYMISYEMAENCKDDHHSLYFPLCIFRLLTSSLDREYMDNNVEIVLIFFRFTFIMKIFSKYKRFLNVILNVYVVYILVWFYNDLFVISYSLLIINQIIIIKELV